MEDLPEFLVSFLCLICFSLPLPWAPNSFLCSWLFEEEEGQNISMSLWTLFSSQWWDCWQGGLLQGLVLWKHLNLEVGHTVESLWGAG